MKALATILLLAAVALAGCTDEPNDFSSERLVMSFIDQADGFSLGIPLWLAPNGASAEDWLEADVIISGNATLAIRETEYGQALWIQGSGVVRYDVEDLLSTETGAEPEAFLDGAYSLGAAANGRPRMVVEYGDVDVTFEYAGVSKDCALFLNHGWTAIGPGVHVAQYGQRADPKFDCVR